MSVQLYHQGSPIDVPIPDQNAACQYLYEYAQNGFQSQVQIIYALPNGSGGEVDPSWPLLQLVNAGAQFQVNLIQGGNPMQTVNTNQEIPINVYVNDQQVTIFNGSAQQSLQDLIDCVNQNLQSQYQSCELYDSLGQGQSNTPSDYIGQFLQATPPLLFFIPGCLSGIQNFVNIAQPPLGQQQAPQPQVLNPALQPPPGIVNQPSTGSISPLKQQSDSSEARIKESIQSLKVQKNFSLFIDQQGQFVIYKFHFPILLQGTLRISNSKPKKSFNEQSYDFVPVNGTKFAEIDDYGFAIKWSNGNISTVKINQQ